MYIACPNCKKITISWDDRNAEFTNFVSRSQQCFGLVCQDCFAERKILPGDPPETCKHGRPLDGKCWECRKEAQAVMDEEKKKLEEINRQLKMEKMRKQLDKLEGKP